jgi:hypothetical protein
MRIIQQFVDFIETLYGEKESVKSGRFLYESKT